MIQFELNHLIERLDGKVPTAAGELILAVLFLSEALQRLAACTGQDRDRLVADNLECCAGYVAAAVESLLGKLPDRGAAGDGG